MQESDLKREISELEITLRNLKNKNQDEETNNKRIRNEKSGIVVAIDKLKREREALSIKVLGIKDKVDKADAEIKDAKFAIVRDRAKIDQRETDIKNEWGKILDAQAVLDKEQKTRNVDKANLKQKKADFGVKEAKFNADKNAFKVTEDVYNIAKADFEKEKVVYNENQLALANKQDEVTKNLDEAKTYRKSFEDKCGELDEAKKTTLHIQCGANNAKVDYEERKKELDDKELQLKAKAEIARQDRFSLSKRVEALQVREDEFEVKRLRLEKSEREGTVKEELAKLKKEAAEKEK